MRVPFSRWFLGAMALVSLTILGCQRGPKSTSLKKADGNEVVVKPKVVPPTRETGVVKLRTIQAFREWGVRETAADALARIGDPAVPALIETLHDPDHSIRAHAARARGCARTSSRRSSFLELFLPAVVLGHGREHAAKL